MDKKIGFIGCGNMGQAMIGGIVKSGLVPPEQVYAADPSEQNLNRVQKEYGICVTQDNLVPAKKCDILVLSVKPYLYADVIEEIRDTVKQDVVIVMIAAGQTIAVNEARFGRNIKIVRAMPNTPALVGEGMAALCANSYVTDEEKDEVREIFESFGKAELVGENMMRGRLSQGSAVLPPPMYICLSKRWRTAPCCRGCRASRHIPLRRRLFWAPHAWFWKPACTQAL